MAIKKFIKLRVRQGDSSTNEGDEFYYDCGDPDMTSFDCYNTKFKNDPSPELLTALPSGTRVECYDTGITTTIPAQLRIISVERASATNPVHYIKLENFQPGDRTYSITIKTQDGVAIIIQGMVKTSSNGVISINTGDFNLPETGTYQISVFDTGFPTIVATSNGVLNVPLKLVITSVGYENQISDPDLRRINVTGQLPGVRDYHLLFRNNDGGGSPSSTINERDVQSIDASTTPYFIFRESVDKILNDGTYWVTLWDLEFPSYSASFKFTVTGKGSGNTTTTPVTTTLPTAFSVDLNRINGQVETMRSVVLKNYQSGTRTYKWRIYTSFDIALIPEQTASSSTGSFNVNLLPFGLNTNELYVFRIYDSATSNIVAATFFTLTGDVNNVVPGEILAIDLTPSSDPADFMLDRIPNYTMPSGAMVPAPGYLNQAQTITFVKHGRNFFDSGFLQGQVASGTLTKAQATSWLAAQNLPVTTGIYRMIYQNSFLEPVWGTSPSDPIQVTVNDFQGFLMGWVTLFKNDFGWNSHPMLIDLDLERAPGHYIGLKTIADAIMAVRAIYPEVMFAMYASSPVSLWSGSGGDASNPYGVCTAFQRYQIFKNACKFIDSSAWYYHFDTQLIGTDGSRPFSSYNDYAEKYIGPIRANIGISEQVRGSVPTGDIIGQVEWMMETYEGGNDGAGNWPKVGTWILEGTIPFRYVIGTFKQGGGPIHWKPWGTNSVACNAIDAGLWRTMQYLEFWNNPNTIYNIKLEWSGDGGVTWRNDVQPDWPGSKDDWSLSRYLYFYNDPNPIIRGAFVNGKLLVVATAKPSTHNGGSTMNIKFRYQGKVWDLSLPPKKVVTFVYAVNS